MLQQCYQQLGLQGQERHWKQLHPAKYQRQALYLSHSPVLRGLLQVPVWSHHLLVGWQQQQTDSQGQPQLQPDQAVYQRPGRCRSQCLHQLLLCLEEVSHSLLCCCPLWGLQVWPELHPAQHQRRGQLPGYHCPAGPLLLLGPGRYQHQEMGWCQLLTMLVVLAVLVVRGWRQQSCQVEG